MKDEIIDSYIPIYTSTLLEVAQHDLWLATTEPEILTKSGDCYAYRLIAFNIYEYLQEEVSIPEMEEEPH